MQYFVHWDEKMATYADELATHGVCVIPFYTTETIDDMRQEFFDTCGRFPEYIQPDEGVHTTLIYEKGRGTKRSRSESNKEQGGGAMDKRCNFYQLGSFGGLSNIASFHNPFVRRLRKEITNQMMPILSNAFSNSSTVLYCQTLFDRMVCRPPGTTISAESAHRDCGPIKNDEWVLQSWINMDHSDQIFSFVPGSHKDPSETSGQKGFVGGDEERMKQEGVRRRIPPKHMVVFYQNILHEVNRVRVKTEHMMRFHVGFFISPRSNGLFTPDHEYAMEKQGLVYLPSGQIPPMYSMNHRSALLWKITKPWSDAVIKDSYKTVIKNTRLCPRHMKNKNLVDMGDSYSPYSEEEKNCMRPKQIVSPQ